MLGMKRRIARQKNADVSSLVREAVADMLGRT